jgi:hypothetical protein
MTYLGRSACPVHGLCLAWPAPWSKGIPATGATAGYGDTLSRDLWTGGRSCIQLGPSGQTHCSQAHQNICTKVRLYPIGVSLVSDLVANLFLGRFMELMLSISGGRE